eukprot:gi/632944216/ref/XP_007887378.1/ PREDICTED: LIM and calponin homology domains-containing protein 1 [Callorhinchus milii]
MEKQRTIGFYRFTTGNASNTFQVTGRSFGDKDFRAGLESGIVLCELLNAIKPGAVKKINRLPTPIAGLDNIALFLRGCEELGLKGSQLFDPGDLQDTTNKSSIKVTEYNRKLKNVLITIYWLGKAANSCPSYSGPTLNLKEFEGLLSLIHKETEDTDSPKRSIRDSGYIDCWDSERSDSLSPPRHARDDSFDSLDSFGSRSQQTPSPEVILKGSSDGRGSDSESDVPQKAPDVKRDDMSLRRASYHEPKANLPFNQYLPNKSNQTAYMPAPLRKKRAERGDHYRKSWSNATSPVGGERPFSHPEPIEEECSDEEFAETLPALSSVRGVEDTEATEKLKVSGGENSGACGKQLLVCVAECSEHEAPKGDTKGEEKDDEEAKLKRMQKAGITVMPASKRYTSPNPFEENSGQTTPDIILRRENAFLTNTQSVDLESEEEGEEEEQKMPDLEKDDLALRRTQLSQFKPKVVTNQFLPGPCTKKDKERWENIKKSSQKAASNSQARHRKRPSPNHIQATESKAVAPQKEKTFLKSQRRSESEEEEPAKAKVPDVQRDDLARRKTLGGLTSRHEPQTFIPTTVTQADMEIWERLKVSTDTSEEAPKSLRHNCEVEPLPKIEVEKATQDDLAGRKARANKRASGSCQRFVHFGPVTEIDQKRWEKLSIAKAGSDNEPEDKAGSCAIKAYTCHLLPSVVSAVVQTSYDSERGDQSQDIAEREVCLASYNDLSSKPEETFTEMCTAEYFRNPPSPVLTVQTVNLNESIYSSSEGEEDEGKIPDLEKDDMMTRRIGATCKAKGPAFQQFLPVPSSQKGESKNEPLKEYEKDTKNVRSSKDEAPWTYSPTAALSDDAGSVSMNDMRPEDDTLVEPHSKARHEEIRNIHNRLREEQDKWQDDLARWKSRRRSASQDLIKRKEEREFVEKIMSGEQNLSDRRKSIKTYKEIVEEKERRENELQEEYKKARNPEEAQAILKRYSQRFIISEAVLESLQLPKCLERSQSVDSDSSSSPTKDTNVLKYLRQQSLPAQKYTATVEAMIIPPSQSQLNFSTGLTSPTRTVASKAVPMLTPKPYSQPKDSQTVLKSFKVDGKIKMNGETSPTFTRVEGKECTSVVSALSLTKSQMFEGVTQVDCHPLISQTDDGKLAARPELVNCLSVNNKENKATEKEGTETSVSIAITQKISTEEKSDSNLSCNEIERQIAVDAAQEDCKEDHRCYSETSTPHDVFSSNLDPKNAIVTEGVTDKSVSLNHEGEEPRESAQKWHVQEMYEPGILQQDKAGDALDSAQRIKNPDSELDDKNHQPADVAELQEPPNPASVPLTVRNSWRRSEFFSQSAEMEAKENLNIPVAPLNIPKCFERWSWDPEEERKRQERWQKEQERLLQERYRREQEKLRQEWEKAQKEVEEEERRYHEEELKIIQETVAPITSRSTGFSNQIPTEWISPPITEENRNPAPIEETAADRKHKQLALQNQKQMVEAENWQPKEECQRLAEEERNRQAAQEKGGQAGEQQRLTSEQVEKLSSKKDENVQKDHWDDTAKNKSENSNWQEVNQLTNEEQRLNLQTVAHTNQMETEVVSERLKHADWQTSTTVHQQPTAQAAGSPVNSDRIWNTQELPPSLELQRMKSHGVQDEQKTMSLDRSWTHQSNTGNTKRSGSHENLQSGQSVPLPHSTSSLQLQSPSRSVSGKKLCSTCRLPLGKGAAMIIETLSLYFHIQCFKCGICQGQLGDATTGTDVRIRNGLLNCHECYIRSRIAGQPTTL